MTAKYNFYRPHKRVTFDGTRVHPFTGEILKDPSKTKQAHIKECDINLILKQFSVTGMVKHVNANAALGRYMDLPDHLDFQQAHQLVVDAEKAFMSLPAKVRDKFGQDPAAFLAFMSDPTNRAEAIELGLVVPPPKQETPPVSTEEKEKPVDK